MDSVTLAAIVMASGFSARFGSDKLQYVINGKSVVARVLEAIPAGYQTFVVTRYNGVKALASGMGFTVVGNDLPYLRDTIRLGLGQALGFPAACFIVADQPWLTRETLVKMRREHINNPACVIRAAHGGRPGNPVIFPQTLYGELLNLEPHESGQAVIKRHADIVRLLEVPEIELRDIDYPTDI